MIKITRGNLLEAPADALVNTVNTEGVMGKGIALQFKRAFPRVNSLYESACKAGEVKLGQMHVVDLGGIGGGPKWVINFPTKGHWRARSRIEDIVSGLIDLVRQVQQLEIKSIAIPPLGCGLGGLAWSDVRPRIESAFEDLPDVQVLLFEPAGAPSAESMPTRTEKPAMTIGRAALIGLMRRYREGLLYPFVSLLEVHKLMYFLQESGQSLRLKFEPARFGPYAKNLRQVLIRLEGHWITGYGDGQDAPEKPLELIGDAEEAAERFLDGELEVRERMDRVARLIEGYEDAYGLELLSSMHWVMCHESGALDSVESAVLAVQAWNPGKQRRLKQDHLTKAWQRLRELRWDCESRSAAR